MAEHVADTAAPADFPPRIDKVATEERRGVSDSQGVAEEQREGEAGEAVESRKYDLPDRDTCLALLEQMALIRRFEEEAGRQYQKAKAGGKTVAFCLAAFRQAYAGGRSLAEEENVMIAAAACEIHPRALLKALETRSIAQRLDEATAAARERGVASTPAFWDGERVLHGDAALEDLVGALRRGAHGLSP